MDWLRKFMMGRYGGDQLSIALIILSFLLTLISGIIRLPILNYIGYIPLIISIFRILSRDTDKRRMENYKFAMFMSLVYSWLKRMYNYVKNSKTERCFRCPNCKTRLWVPRGKGKIIITCPKCKTEFRERT